MSTKGTHIPDWLQVPFAGITPAPSQQKGQDLFPTGNWRAIRPVYRDKMPPCNNACGTNEKIQGYLDLVKRGKYLDAYALIKEDMPFPSVTGRVCYHPCEQACNRGQYDEAISIRAVERFLGDLGQALPHDVVKAGTPNGKKVAVIGSGPAGHSAAYQLARLGYAVTILEKSPKAGGLNRGGIPDWVLPQHVLDREIERLVELGITIRTNTEVGKDVTWDDLKNTYDACVLAVGLTEPNSVRAEGEDKDGVLYGLPFLRDIGMGTSSVKLGPRVAVIGGGNTAIDCAREALRQGAEEVTMITVEGTTGEMPCVPEDLHDMVEEGVELMHGLAMTAVLGNGKVEALQLHPARFTGPINASPIAIDREAAAKRFAVDNVIVAVGQHASLKWLPDEFKTERGSIKIDRHGRLGDTMFFAAGDVVQLGSGPAADGGERRRRRQASRLQSRQGPSWRAAPRANGLDRRHHRSEPDEHDVLPALRPREAADAARRQPPPHAGRSHPGLHRRTGGGRGEPVLQLRHMQCVRQLLPGVPGAVHHPVRSLERALQDPGRLLQRLSRVHRGVPDRLPRGRAGARFRYGRGSDGYGVRDHAGTARPPGRGAAEAARSGAEGYRELA